MIVVILKKQQSFCEYNLHVFHLEIEDNYIRLYSLLPIYDVDLRTEKNISRLSILKTLKEKMVDPSGIEPLTS